jgi:hypothetical protein
MDAGGQVSAAITGSSNELLPTYAGFINPNTLRRRDNIF